VANMRMVRGILCEQIRDGKWRFLVYSNLWEWRTRNPVGLWRNGEGYGEYLDVVGLWSLDDVVVWARGFEAAKLKPPTAA